MSKTNVVGKTNVIEVDFGAHKRIKTEIEENYPELTAFIEHVYMGEPGLNINFGDLDDDE